MSDNILLLGHERKYGLELVNLLMDMGYRPIAQAWENFTPRSFGRPRPALLIADLDTPSAPTMRELSPLIRKVWGKDFPILAVSRSGKCAEVEALLEAGASDFMKKGSPRPLAEKKIARCLEGENAFTLDHRVEDIPPALASLFLDNPRLVRLRDLADLHAGATPRRPWSRRHAPPDKEWRPVATAAIIGRFQVGKPVEYLLWNRLHLFRMPAPAEYAVPEKVLLPRYGPPLLAAVDRSRLPAGADVYALVPRDGVSAGYIACLLNSRLVDFYCNRLASSPDGRLRAEMIRDLPVPKPDPRSAGEFVRIGSMLTHFGPSPESWIDRQNREECGQRLEDLAAEAYGAGREAREGLRALHF